LDSRQKNHFDFWLSAESIYGAIDAQKLIQQIHCNEPNMEKIYFISILIINHLYKKIPPPEFSTGLRKASTGTVREMVICAGHGETGSGRDGV
jgi:hypothetical protein